MVATDKRSQKKERRWNIYKIAIADDKSENFGPGSCDRMEKDMNLVGKAKTGDEFQVIKDKQQGCCSSRPDYAEGKWMD